MSTGDFQECKVCHEWGWFNSKFMAHECKPAWECRADDGDDAYWTTIYARDGEQAAEKFAQHYDYNGAEYSICGGEEQPIMLVRQVGSETIERWQVFGEMAPSYRAEKPEDEEQ